MSLSIQMRRPTIVVSDDAGLIARGLEILAQTEAASVPRVFLTRAEVAAYRAAETPAIGARLAWPAASVIYTGVGAIIPDLPGCVPDGDVTPDHWAFNASPGATDMTAAMQAAVDFIALRLGVFGGGGNVYLRGRYRITAPIRIRQSGTWIIGENKNATRVDFSTGFSAFHFGIDNSQLSPISAQFARGGIRDMHIWCNATNPAVEVGVILDRCADTHIENVNVYNAWRAVEFRGNGESCKLIGSDITSGSNTTTLQAGSAGVAILRAQTIASDPVAVLDATDGLFYTEPNSVYIDNVNIRSNNFGQEFNVLVEAVDGLYFTNSHLGFPRGACLGIRPRQANISIAAMQFTGVYFDPDPVMTDYGIWVNDFYSTNSQVMGGLQINGGRVAAPRLDGVRIAARMDRTSLIGMDIESCGSYGVHASGNSAELIIQGCHFWDNSKTLAFDDIFLGSVSSPVILGNTFSAGNNGVNVSTSAVRATITDNTFTNKTGLSVVCPATSAQEHVIRDNRIVESSTVAAGASVTLPAGQVGFTISGAGAVANINPAWTGREVRLLFSGTGTIVQTGNIRLRSPFQPIGTNSSITLAFDGTNWRETSRAQIGLSAVNIAIANNAVATVTPSRPGGFLFITSGADVGANNVIEGGSGVIFFDCGITPTANRLVFSGISSDLDVSTAVLTGTTGGVGKVTVSPQSNGTILIENRQGGTINFQIFIM